MRAQSEVEDGSRGQVWHGAIDGVSSGSDGRMSNITSNLVNLRFEGY